MSTFSESAREREMFKYQPTYLSRLVYVGEGQTAEPREVTGSPDATLTAFAQLGALRLGCTRALVSLCDSRYQYILAEATPSLAVAPNARPASEPLYFCGSAVLRSSSVCEHVLINHSSQLALQSETPISARDQLPVSVVPDLRGDKRFQVEASDADSTSGPVHRFYSGVPIRTARGYNIGVYCVFDDKPRNGLDPDSIALLRDMSQTVMDYLESRRTTESYRRGERMVRGLGSFVEGMGTMTGWRHGPDVSSLEQAVDGQEGVLNEKQQRLRDDAISPSEENSSRGPLASPLQNTRPAQAEAPTSYIQATTNSNSSSPDTRVAAIKGIFSRAANIIRESIEVEGAVFLDASVGTFGGLIKHSKAAPASPGPTSGASSSEEGRAERSEESSDLCCSVFGFSTSSGSSIDGASATSGHSNVPQRFLRKMLRRYPRGLIYNFDESGAIQSGDSESDDATRRTSNEVAGSKAETGKQSTRSRALQKEADRIQNMFPGARGVALISLWDASRDRWLAGGFFWTKTPNRIFTIQGELSWLKAFGSAVMAEVARVDALIADKAKSDIMSSLSHELRSPLHGVVASVELLHDTKLDVFQSDVVHTIETCGRTLLDTIDHLLDFSKINNFAKDSKSLRRKSTQKLAWTDGQKSIDRGMKSLVSDLRLDLLTEEVIESVYAGHSQQKRTTANMSYRDIGNNANTAAAAPRLHSVDAAKSFGGRDGRVHSRTGSNAEAEPVNIYLDIDSAVSWSFHSQAGALRRIIMNIFGNSLKYTEHGSIRICLKREVLRSRQFKSGALVTIAIEDTGKGIGQDYLRNQLFTPFSQEDRLSPGTGLGMSLVRQITTTLGGTVNVSSEVGRGTIVSVALPLPPAQQQDESQDSLSAGVQTLKGLRVSLHGFDDTQLIGPMLQDSDSQTRTELGLVESLCRERLHLEVVAPLGAKPEQADLVLCKGTAYEALLVGNEPNGGDPRVLVICRDAVTARSLQARFDPSGRRGTCKFISQPVGPRKIASAAADILERARVSQPSVLEPPPSSQSQTLNSPGNIPANPRPHLAIPSTPQLDIQVLPEGDGAETRAQSPPADASATATPAPHGDSPPSAAGGESQDVVEKQAFLLVDDNKINLQILEAYLKKLGRPYDLATDGLQALNLYKARPGHYCCVLMDISMPVMDGLESTRKIREFERAVGLKAAIIIALTGLALNRARQDAFTSGTDLFLTKPVRLKELGEALESLMDL